MIGMCGLFLAMPLHAQRTSQHVFLAIVQNAHEKEPLIGVNVRVEGTLIGAATDADGRVQVRGIPSGTQTLVFSFIGFETVKRSFIFPLANPDTVHIIFLEERQGELEGISVSATRTSRTISDQATRVETIAGEEVDEKISMEPANISMLLNESPGIMVQQTSAVSGGASIRIQGLDGRYTQILKDGFPLFGGFSGGLSLLQVPPLDLQQVEIIKGPASTLYGGDAIAGLVNLVTKGPVEGRTISLLANITSANGYDLGGFYRARGERLGITILTSGNVQKAYDSDNDAFSNLPEIRRLTLNPKFFYYPSDRTTLSIGLNGTFEDREGGDMAALDHGPTLDRLFLERNTSTRLTSQVRLDHTMNEASSEMLGGKGLFTLKNSVSLFERTIEVPGYRFDGQQLATYSEASLLIDGESHDLVAGLDLRSDAFREDPYQGAQVRDYTYTSTGAFAQDTWDVSQRVVVEAGLRADYNNTFGLFMLPKGSILYRVSDEVSTRIGGGLGYKAPTVFLEPSEERAFNGVIPLGEDVEAETSLGGSVDVNINTLLFDRVALSLNQAFYFTTLNNPLIPIIEFAEGGVTEALNYVNANGEIRTRAWESNAKLSYRDFKLSLIHI